MFDPNSQSTGSHQSPMDKNSTGGGPPEFPFSYNILQKGEGQASANKVPCTNSADRFDLPEPTFSYNYALVNQMSLAAAGSTVQTFPCDICGLVFGHLALLNSHKKIHIDATIRYPCDMCNLTFGLEGDLKVHKESAHVTPAQIQPELKKSCGIQTEPELDTPKKKKCLKCLANSKDAKSTDTEEFKETDTLSLQQKEDGTILYPKGYYPVKRKRVATIAKCHKCDGSGIVMVNPVPTTEHEKKFICNICNSAFSTYSSLWSHRRLHSGDKPYKCDVCGVAFARSAYLKNHGRVHTGERPYKCNVCEMQFSQSAHLKNHERIHSGERPYECDICNKTFARHSTLWNHRRIHTGEKPYECGICGSAFNQATHLRNHVKVHTGEKQFSCDVCSVGFSDRFALKRHRAVHEKFNQTAPGQILTSVGGPLQTQTIQIQEWPKISQIIQPQLSSDLYKCSMPPPAGGLPSFPGCSHPTNPENK